jgi:hypothetical protein
MTETIREDRGWFVVMVRWSGTTPDASRPWKVLYRRFTREQAEKDIAWIYDHQRKLAVMKAGS